MLHEVVLFGVLRGAGEFDWPRQYKDNDGGMQGWGSRRLSVLDLGGHLCCEVD